MDFGLSAGTYPLDLIFSARSCSEEGEQGMIMQGLSFRPAHRLSALVLMLMLACIVGSPEPVGHGELPRRPKGVNAEGEEDSSLRPEADALIPRWPATGTRPITLQGSEGTRGWAGGTERKALASIAPVIVSGMCAEKSSWNGIYNPVSLTRSGRLWYRNDNGGKLYWDPACDGSTPYNEWIFDNTEPSVTAESDLDGGKWRGSRARRLTRSCALSHYHIV